MTKTNIGINVQVLYPRLSSQQTHLGRAAGEQPLLQATAGPRRRWTALSWSLHIQQAINKKYIQFKKFYQNFAFKVPDTVLLKDTSCSWNSNSQVREGSTVNWVAECWRVGLRKYSSTSQRPFSLGAPALNFGVNTSVISPSTSVIFWLTFSKRKHDQTHWHSDQL